MKPRNRLATISLALLTLFSLLIVRFYQIQIIEGAKWARIAKGQHELLVTLPAKRGRFFGNTQIKKGHPARDTPYVTDVVKFHLYADPMAIKGGFKEEIGLKLSELIAVPSPVINSHLSRKSRSRKLMMWLDPEKKKEIETWWHPFARLNRIPKNAIYFIQDYKRSYPFDKQLGQVLHTVCDERDHKTGEWLPTGGLEMLFDDLLKGKNGKSLLLRSPRHPLDTGIVLEEPVDGADIHLTINPYLQAIAEEGIEEAVIKSGAKGGYAILMDPEDGAILAMAQVPFFRPAEYRTYYNDPSLVNETKVKGITDCLEPGSTLKPLTMSIMLLANEEFKKRGEPPLFDPDEMIRTDRRFFPGRSKELKDVRLHTYLNMDMAIQKSSNVYLSELVVKLIERLGPNWYREKLTSIYGLGEKTGIELPAESPGFIPTPGKKYASGLLQWSGPTPYSLMMGYNLQVNAIQLLRAWSVLANRGHLVQPTLIRKIVKEGEEITPPHPAPRRVLPASVAERIVGSTKYATKPGGSAFRADIYGYTEAGKTSTAEKLDKGGYNKKRHFSCFVGFAPANKPRFVLVVGIDDPVYRYLPGIGRTHYGGKCAAPAFKAIATRALHYLGVAPDDPTGYPKGDPRSDLDEADWMEETRELAKIYKEWNG